MFARLSVRWTGAIFILVLVLLAIPHAAQVAPYFPLANPGPYTVGYQLMLLTDASRDGRNLTVQVWYPANKPTKPTPQQRIMPQYGWLKAPPDPEAAPYPLILDSPAWSTTIIDPGSLSSDDMILASWGFVVVTLPNSHPDEDKQNALIDRPLDILFILDQLTALNPKDFAGVIDTEHVGVMGSLLGAYTTLALTGARIDPAVKVWANTPPDPSDQWDIRNVWAADWNWDKLVAYRASLTALAPLNGDDLWPPFGDPRIHAALMLIPCNAELFGERGLGTAAVPSMIVGVTPNEFCPYQQEAAGTFAHLGAPDRSMLSIMNGGKVTDPEDAELTQLMVAFFGAHLKGEQNEARYVTAHYVDNVEALFNLGLVWGPYNGG